MNTRRAAIYLIAGTILAVPFAQTVFAQAFPSKPIRIIVPFPPGGTTDIVARIVANRMTENMGQPVTVENRGGGGGTIGADAVAKAPPDGYTMMMGNLTFPIGRVDLRIRADDGDGASERSRTRSARTGDAAAERSVAQIRLWFDRPGLGRTCDV
jgi:Tripartite tricarboxylate transporter family receptor